MSTVYQSVSPTRAPQIHSGAPQPYVGRHRKQRLFTARRLAVALLTTFWTITGTIGLVEAYGTWSA